MTKHYFLYGVTAVFVLFLLSACQASSEETQKSEEPPKEEAKAEEIEPKTKTIYMEKEEKEQEKDDKQKEKEEEIKPYTADEAFSWLKKSGLVSGEGSDITGTMKDLDVVKKAIRTDEADIIQYKSKGQAKECHSPHINTFAVNNICVVVKNAEANPDMFIEVLKSGKPLNIAATSYTSGTQEVFVKLSENHVGFETYADAFYAIPEKEKAITFNTYIIDKEVI